MSEELPGWARRIRVLREGRGLTVAEAADAMRQYASRELPEAGHIERRWKAWEAGENQPGPEYRPLIASALGTVTATVFPPADRPARSDLLGETGMDTLEIVSRLQASDVNDATLDAVRFTVEKLCSQYASHPPAEVIVEGQEWLRRLVELQDQRLSLRQRVETLELAGWLTLLVGCLEYDLGDRRRAETTRKAALRLGQEVESAGIIGWAHEMRAWFALTAGDYRGVLSAAEAGQAAAGNHSVAVQLIAQQAKALARMGRRHEMNSALERGRVLLESMPYPDNTENHFVVDPLKYDFYVMDCYRHVGDDRHARALAREVIADSTDFSGTERAPMRIAEARVTLGVAAAREGELDEAVEQGRQALSGSRKSIPSIAMVSADLANVLAERFHHEPAAASYLEQLNGLKSSH